MIYFIEIFNNLNSSCIRNIVLENIDNITNTN